MIKPDDSKPGFHSSLNACGVLRYRQKFNIRLNIAVSFFTHSWCFTSCLCVCYGGPESQRSPHQFDNTGAVNSQNTTGVFPWDTDVTQMFGSNSLSVEQWVGSSVFRFPWKHVLPLPVRLCFDVSSECVVEVMKMFVCLNVLGSPGHRTSPPRFDICCVRSRTEGGTLLLNLGSNYCDSQSQFTRVIFISSLTPLLQRFYFTSHLWDTNNRLNQSPHPSSPPKSERGRETTAELINNLSLKPKLDKWP